MAEPALLTRFSTLRKKHHKPKTNQDRVNSNAAHPLYLAVLQAVSIPVFEAAQAKITPYTPEKSYLKPSKKSLVRNDNLFIAADSIEYFKKSITQRAEVMQHIEKEDAKEFTSLSNRLKSYAFDSFTPMINIKSLIECIAYHCMDELKIMYADKSLRPVEYDEKLSKSIELYLALIKEALQAESGVSYEVRNHYMLRYQSLKHIVSKYFLTSSLTLEDSDSNLSMGIRNTFEVSDDVHQASLNRILQSYNEGSVYGELKKYLTNLTNGSQMGYQVRDFQSQDAFQQYVNSETAVVNGLLRAFELRYPNAPLLSETAPLGINMPNDQKTAEKYYRVIVKLLLERDLNETGGQIIMSKLSKSVLNECAFRWKISKEFRTVALFDYQVKRFIAGSFQLKDITTILSAADALSQNPQLLRKPEIDLLLHAYVEFNRSLDSLLGNMLGMVHYKHLTAENCSDLLQLLSKIKASFFRNRLCNSIQQFPVCTNSDIELYMSQIIKASAAERANQIMTKIEKTFVHPDEGTTRISNIIQIFTSDLQKYQLYYQSPLLESEWIHSLAAEVYIGIANTFIERNPSDPDSDMKDILELYQIIREFYDYCQEVGVSAVNFIDIESLFIPSINSWLARTDATWLEWVQRAYLSDENNGFKAVLSPHNLNSSSVIDIFTAFQGGLSFLGKFRFKDPATKENLKCSFVKAMHTTIERYCELNFDIFDQFNQLKKDDIQNFTVQQITKCNNILAAQSLFEELLESLNNDSQGKSEISPTATRTELNNVPTYEVKLIGAKNLAPQNFQAPDAFVVMLIGGELVGASATVPQNSNPIWNCHYDIQLSEEFNTDSDAFLEFIVFHENRLGEDIPNGTASVFLKTSQFDSFLSQNIHLMLRPEGSLTVRMRREGLIDDINWYMQRTKETIRFTVEDMIECFSSRIILGIENVVEKIVTSTQGTTIFGISIAKGQEVSDETVEIGLVPVLQYLDYNLGLFNQYCDRRFDDYLLSLYPEVGKAVDGSEEQIAIIDIQPTLPRSTLQIHRKGALNKKSKPNKIPSLAEVKHPSIIHIIWHKILSYCYSTIDGCQSKTDLTEIERRQVLVLESMIEFIKSVLYCQIGKKVYGLKQEELETMMYRQLRILVDEILNPK
ncbi:hypothetical protein BC833DRAFT_574483 [Globomyces pollinis-pini]|nr:hypothetical protein BC833DRAFT_574483 [Globomyces pollinis-pini]